MNNALLPAETQDLPAKEVISDEAALKAFLASNLEGVDPDEMTAASVFSAWLLNKVDVPTILVAMQLDNLAKCTRTLDIAFKDLEQTDRVISQKHRNLCMKQINEAINTRSMLLQAAMDMAKGLKPAAAEGKKKPKNRGPDSLLVQINNQVQGSKESERFQSR